MLAFEIRSPNDVPASAVDFVDDDNSIVFGESTKGNSATLKLV
jgi:hypothetical protein